MSILESKEMSIGPAISIVYHDVVKPGQCDASGFPGKLAGRYKLDYEDFVKHLEAIRAVTGSRGVDTTGVDTTGVDTTGVDTIDSRGHSPRLYLTFDDGGSSAYTCIADSLERFGWRGHFFVTTNYIDTKSFLTQEQIRELRRRGHVIGSHSSSHPPRISALGWDQLVSEWRVSVEALADILGEPVLAAAVPGGFYSRTVARAAAAAGIRTLFTSEPTTSLHQIDGCTILGRYAIVRGMTPDISAALVSGTHWVRARQRLAWNIKKPLKSLRAYSWLRKGWLNAVYREAD